MQRVRHIVDGSPWPRGYSGPGVSGLLPGDVAEVPDELVAYLVSTFPDHFVVVAAPPAPSPPAASSPVTQSAPSTTTSSTRRKPPKA